MAGEEAGPCLQALQAMARSLEVAGRSEAEGGMTTLVTLVETGLYVCQALC